MLVGFDDGEEGKGPFFYPGLRPVIEKYNVRYYILDTPACDREIEYHVLDTASCD